MKLDHIIAVRDHKTVYRDGDYAIKAFEPGYSKADIFNEALNQARVEETALNIPRLREVTMIDGRWCIISDFIVGKTLGQLMEEQKQRHDEYLQQFVDLQILVHSKSCPTLNRLKEKMTRKINQTGLDATTRYELQSQLDMMPTHNKLCHGDFDPRNIIITASGDAYILDWAHATQGNASADAARTYLVFWLGNDSGSAARYLELFCRRSDTAIQYIEKWIPIVAASLGTKGRAAEREHLLHWINKVDQYS